MFAALVGACVRLLPFLSSLCSQDAGLVGACVPRLPFALVAELVVLGFLVTVLVSACVPWLPFWSA